MIVKYFNNFVNESRKPSGYWTDEKLQEFANKCENRTEFRKNKGAYYSAQHKKIVDDLFKNHTNNGYSYKRNNLR